MNTAVTKADILQQSRAPAPASEATHIEQSRAIAQVQGALIVAQQRPRDEIRAIQRVREACSIQALAERAFFRFPRGGQTVTGPSIHLAAELARCWGNIDFGITELRRDEHRAESEMLAVAWDLETNTRVTNSFIVPHKRDKRGGAELLTDMRDIYENNANNAARRLRECIFRCIPTYVVEEAKRLCMETLEHGGGEPLSGRIEKLLAAFAGIGITRRQIEKRIGVAADRMQPVDIANLRIIYQSIRRGETRAEDEFQAEHGEDITADLKAARNGNGNGKAAAKAPAADEAASEPETVGEIVDNLPPADESQAGQQAADQPADPAAQDEPAAEQPDDGHPVTYPYRHSSGQLIVDCQTALQFVNSLERGMDPDDTEANAALWRANHSTVMQVVEEGGELAERLMGVQSRFVHVKPAAGRKGK